MNPLAEEVTRYTSHGIMVLNLLAHQPVEFKENLYTGLAPASTFIFLPATKPDRIKAGLKWILDQGLNIRILLNLMVPQEQGWMSSTHQDPYVRALQPAADAGLLIIAAGGNSKAHNNLPPKHFLVVGGFNDKGSSDRSQYEIYPSAAYGVNGDGHYRICLRPILICHCQV